MSTLFYTDPLQLMGVEVDSDMAVINLRDTIVRHWKMDYIYWQLKSRNGGGTAKLICLKSYFFLLQRALLLQFEL